ncbi:hypothetical protein ACFTAO_00680 [Paenibacillus rhizoplanae]
MDRGWLAGDEGWIECSKKMEVEGLIGVELKVDRLSHDVFDDFNQGHYDIHFSDSIPGPASCMGEYG